MADKAELALLSWHWFIICAARVCTVPGSPPAGTWAN